MLNLEWGESLKTPCALLLGGFDGLHRGHEILLRAAKEAGVAVAATTMYGCKAGGEVFTRREREAVFEKAGVFAAVHIPFGLVKDISAQDFLKLLTEKINVQSVYCGEDFRFGKGAEGNTQTLERELSCPVNVFPVALHGGKKIAISTVKALLREGDMYPLNALLLENYFIEGEVEHGRRVGRTLDFPTANLTLPADKFPLREGVYAGKTEADGKLYRAVINVGARPTFGVEEKKLEAYLLDFSGDLYGKRVRVYPERFLRPVYKFASVEELKNQLKKDIENA